MENNRAPGLWLRFGVIIACFALIISAVIIAPGLLEDEPESGLTDDPSDDKDGLGAGAIVGIVIGSVAVVGIGGFALFWFVIKKKSFADLIAIFKK